MADEKDKPKPPSNWLQLNNETGYNSNATGPWHHGERKRVDDPKLRAYLLRVPGFSACEAPEDGEVSEKADPNLPFRWTAPPRRAVPENAQTK